MPSYRRSSLQDLQDAFSGGINLTADDSQLAPNEMRQADNGRLTTFGAITKRGGTQRVTTSAGNPVRGGYGWSKDSGATQQLYVAGGTLYTGTYGVPFTATGTATGLSSTAYPAFAAFQDGSGEVCYIADGTLKKWNGTTLTTAIAGTPTKITRIALQNRRLFGISGDSEYLYWSALDNGDSLGNTSASGGYDPVRTFGKEPLTALLPLGDSLLLFHRSGISRFTGWSQDDIAIQSGTRGVSSDTGTIAPDSIVAVENTAYFLSERGFYACNEGSVAPMGQKIESVIRTLDHSQFARVKAVHLKATTEVAWYLPDVGCYVYNYRLHAWSGPWTGIFTSSATTALWATVDANSTPVVLSGHTDGYVRLLDAPGLALDDVQANGTGGVGYTLIAKCRRFYYDEPETEKAHQAAYLQLNAGGSTQATVQWSSETGTNRTTLPYVPSGTWSASATWSAAQTWGAGGTGSTRVLLDQRGKYLDITYSDAGASLPVLSRVRVAGAGYGPRY